MELLDFLMITVLSVDFEMYYPTLHFFNFIQGDLKPLRQTLRVDRVNNKEHFFLLNNLCLLTRRVVSKLPLVFVTLF